MSDLFGNDDNPQRKGGRARAEKLSPEKRTEIARAAAATRWGNAEVARATYGSADRPLRIGALEIPCYVLEDGRRVLSLNGMIDALGMTRGGSGQGDRLARFARGSRVLPYVHNGLLSRMENPIRFRAPSGGTVASGFEATMLPDLCDAVLDARKAKALRRDQFHIADRCEMLVRGFARVGIIALVDEATGYQEVRDRKALEDILNKYISEELRKWTPTFPDDYFTQVFRLRGWKMPSFPTARPGIMAHYTNDIVYLRLAPGVLQELQRINPIDSHGRRKHKHFQHLTGDYGHPKLKEHLNDVVLLMKASISWMEFRRLLDRVKPRVNVPGDLPLLASAENPS